MSILQANPSRVETGHWQENNLSGDHTNGSAYTVTVPEVGTTGADSLSAALNASHVKWQYNSPPLIFTVFSILSVVAFPAMILAVIYYVLIKPQQKSVKPELASYTGRGSDNTGMFTIPMGRRAQYSWTTSTGKADGSFEATLRRSENDAPIQPIVSIVGEGAGNTTSFHEGTLYINVESDVLWMIKVYLV